MESSRFLIPNRRSLLLFCKLYRNRRKNLFCTWTKKSNVFVGISRLPVAQNIEVFVLVTFCFTSWIVKFLRWGLLYFWKELKATKQVGICFFSSLRKFPIYQDKEHTVKYLYFQSHKCFTETLLMSIYSWTSLSARINISSERSYDTS